MREDLMDSARTYAHRAHDTVEDAAGKIPSDLFLIGALGSIGISLVLKLSGRDRDAEFVGHWAPTFLALGLFSKLIEHDKKSR
jgi:hypothetical protein